MTHMNKHTEGTFSYADLQTSDLDAARSFYTTLFGWEVDEQPMGEEGGIYAMFKKDGRTTSAASKQPPQQAEAGVPPMWTAYFTVYDIDTRTKEVEQIGGTIHAGPFDVFDAGRMSVIQDPNGAFFALWEPKANIGAEVMNEANSLCWAECYASDVIKAKNFYGSLLGWTFDDVDMGGGMTYTLCKVVGEEQSVCGVMEPPAPGMPSFWLVYFEVESCDSTAAQARALGGEVKNGPMDIPGVGRFAILGDPQGAGFGILQTHPATQS